MPSPTSTLRPEKRTKAGALAADKRRSCYFCKENIEEVDVKSPTTLRRTVSDKGKIRSRRVTGSCKHHQSQVAAAVKRAREMALLPNVSR